MEKLSEENKDITEFTSEKLADIIILNRYLGLYDEVAKSAMEELANRRKNGDNFQYETYINDHLNSMPKINFKIPKFSSLYNLIKLYIKL